MPTSILFFDIHGLFKPHSIDELVQNALHRPLMQTEPFSQSVAELQCCINGFSGTQTPYSLQVKPVGQSCTVLQAAHLPLKQRLNSGQSRSVVHVALTALVHTSFMQAEPGEHCLCEVQCWPSSGAGNMGIERLMFSATGVTVSIGVSTAVSPVSIEASDVVAVWISKLLSPFLEQLGIQKTAAAIMMTKAVRLCEIVFFISIFLYDKYEIVFRVILLIWRNWDVQSVLWY